MFKYRTQRELVVLRKAYIYKTLQVVVLPSIGLTRYEVNYSVGRQFNWYLYIVWVLLVTIFLNIEPKMRLIVDWGNVWYWQVCMWYDTSVLFSCIFLPNNGAIFISYIIIATFISNPIELIRLPQLIMYCYGRLVARTRYERKQVLRKVSYSMSVCVGGVVDYTVVTVDNLQ